jgi:hypothetical protein
MTERPRSACRQRDDAHIIQIREPQPGTPGNMNWFQNGGSSRDCY